MPKELILTVWLHDDANVNAVTDALNEVLLHPNIYPLIDDTDDEGWSYYNEWKDADA